MSTWISGAALLRNGSATRTLEDAIWVQMTSFYHAEGTYSIPEGEAVKEMLVIIQGQQ